MYVTLTFVCVPIIEGKKTQYVVHHVNAEEVKQRIYMIIDSYVDG